MEAAANAAQHRRQGGGIAALTEPAENETRTVVTALPGDRETYACRPPACRARSSTRPGAGGGPLRIQLFMFGYTHGKKPCSPKWRAAGRKIAAAERPSRATFGARPGQASLAEKVIDLLSSQSAPGQDLGTAGQKGRPRSLSPTRRQVINPDGCGLHSSGMPFMLTVSIPDL